MGVAAGGRRLVDGDGAYGGLVGEEEGGAVSLMDVQVEDGGGGDPSLAAEEREGYGAVVEDAVAVAGVGAGVVGASGQADADAVFQGVAGGGDGGADRAAGALDQLGRPGETEAAEVALDSTIQMIRNIPALAMIPLVILWFGIDEKAKLFLVALGVFFPVYINTYHGIRSVDAHLIEMAKSYGVRGFALYRDVILPGALPSILVGVRFALGLMWVMLIVAETISAQSGIGYMTMNAREFLQTDVVVVGILLYAVLGKLADVLAKWLERVTLRWHPAYQSGAKA